MRGGRFALFASLLCASFDARVAGADVITHIPTNDKVVALTFDACEAGDPMSFDRGILDYLLARKLPFTLFVTGKFVESNTADVEALAALDFVEIENHSWSHPNWMDHYEPEAVVRQVERGHEAIVSATGRSPQFFRFPAGNYNADGLKAVERLGYKVVHWRWASGDPDPRETADALFHRVTSNVAAGDILIFHINGRGYHTAEALPRIVERLEADGYRFVLISDYIGRPRPRGSPPPSATTVSLWKRFDDWLARFPFGALPRALN